MKNVKLYTHSGSKNHGCEAIVRATAQLLPYNLDLYSLSPEEDKKYLINEKINIIQDKVVELQKPTLKYYLSAVEIKSRHTTILNTRFRRPVLFSDVQKDDLFLSIGGDNYCYAGTEVLGDINYLLHKKGAKTVLWGCSIDPDVLKKSVVDDLNRYNLITVRESLTYKALQQKGVKNLILCSDPAFTLRAEKKDLPEGYIQEKTVGINVSPLVEQCGKGTLVIDNYIKLIKYILTETDFSVILVPHVVWNYSDDRKSLNKLMEKFKDSGRVYMIPDCNCMQLKGYISKCRFFVGARTHATIAAYSTEVPTLVVGYSIKARGIAKDIFGTDENYVISAQNFGTENDLKNAFVWCLDREKEIKNHLKRIMPAYCSKAYLAVDALEKLI